MWTIHIPGISSGWLTRNQLLAGQGNAMSDSAIRFVIEASPAASPLCPCSPGFYGDFRTKPDENRKSIHKFRIIRYLHQIGYPFLIPSRQNRIKTNKTEWISKGPACGRAKAEQKQYKTEHEGGGGGRTGKVCLYLYKIGLSGLFGLDSQSKSSISSTNSQIFFGRVPISCIRVNPWPPVRTE